MIRVLSAAAVAAALVWSAPASQAQTPSSTLGARPEAALCADPAQRKAFVDGFETSFQTWSTTLKTVGDAEEARVDAKRAAFQRAAGEEAMMDLMLAIMGDEAFMNAAMGGMNAVQPMFASLGAYQKAKDAGKEPEACAHAVKAAHILFDMEPSVVAQWRYMARKFDEAAAARGIKLD